MKTRTGVACAALALGIIAVGCSETDAADVDLDQPAISGRAIPEVFEARVPDSVTVFQNVDNHPTIVRVCLDGIAFRTISTTHSQGGFNTAVERVPEWDEACS